MADLDDRFRSLSRMATPDLWQDIEGREPRSGIPPTPWSRRALAAAVALVIAVAGIGFVAVTFGGSEEQPAPGSSGGPRPAEITTSAEVVETFAVGEDVRSVVYGEDSVWVAVSNNDGTFAGRILRIDPETHAVQAEIGVDVIPTWEVGGGAMVVHDGSLWVAGSFEPPSAFDDPGGVADAAVIQIDTTTNEVVQTFELGGAHGADLTFLDGELWVLVFGDDPVETVMEIVRVDRRTGEIEPRFTLDAGWAHTLVASGGRLVTAVGGDGAVNEDGRVVVIDPVGGGISTADVPSRFFTPMPVVSRGVVWVSLDPGFARLDPIAVSFEPEVSLPARFSDCCGFVEADDRGVWFLSLDPQTGTDRQLNLVEPETGEVTELVVLEEGAPVAMAVAPDSVWILNYEGTLTHVALG